jgi:hypothetical protein
MQSLDNKVNNFKSPELVTTFTNLVNDICNNNPTNFLDVLNSKEPSLSTEYLINNKTIKNSFVFNNSTNNTNIVDIDINTIVNQTELNKQKLKQKIYEKQNIRQGISSKKYNNYKNNDDPNITHEMKSLHKKATKKLNNIKKIFNDITCIPPPAEIMKHTNNYKKETIQRVLSIYLMNNLSQQQKTDLLEGSFFKYMMFMTKITKEEIMNSLSELVKNYNNKMSEKTNHNCDSNCNHDEHNNNQNISTNDKIINNDIVNNDKIINNDIVNNDITTKIDN